MDLHKGQLVKFRDDFSRHVRGIVWVVDSEPAPWLSRDDSGRLFVWLVMESDREAWRSAWVDDLRAVE